MINWDLIISDFNLKGTYGHFLVVNPISKVLDLVFYHYHKFDYDYFSPSLDPLSDLSTDFIVVDVTVHRQFDNFWGVIILDKSNFISRNFKSKYNLDVHK